MTTRVRIQLNVNGLDHTLTVEPHRMLLDTLREDLRLIGPKECCREGECGACTVILDDLAVNSCLVLAVAAQGKEITTVEGLGKPEALHPLQKAFVEHGAIQCGFCTPGLLMALTAYLRENPYPSAQEVRMAIAGNVCRCTGYSAVVEAALRAAAMET